MPKSALPFASLNLEPLGLADQKWNRFRKLESTSLDISGISWNLHKTSASQSPSETWARRRRLPRNEIWQSPILISLAKVETCWNRQTVRAVHSQLKGPVLSLDVVEARWSMLKHVEATLPMLVPTASCMFQTALYLQERFSAVTSCSASIRQSLEVKPCTAATASNTSIYSIYSLVSCSSLHLIITFCCSCINWAEHQVAVCERLPTGQISPACCEILRTSVSCIGTSCGKVWNILQVRKKDQNDQKCCEETPNQNPELNQQHNLLALFGKHMKTYMIICISTYIHMYIYILALILIFILLILMLIVILVLLLL